MIEEPSIDFAAVFSLGFMHPYPDSFVLNSTLSFLLVFRLNRAAGRYWDARGMWGTIVANTRTLVGGLVVHGNHDVEQRDDALRWIAAFSIATMELLRNAKELPLAHFAGILTKDQIRVLQSQKHPPMYAADKARYHLKELFFVDDDTSPSKGFAWTQQLQHLEEQLNALVWSGGGMERIKGSPLPVVYVSHLRTFLLVRTVRECLVYFCSHDSCSYLFVLLHQSDQSHLVSVCLWTLMVLVNHSDCGSISVRLARNRVCCCGS